MRGLCKDDIKRILCQAQIKAKNVKSSFRRDIKGDPTHSKVHIALALRGDDEGTVMKSMDDAWHGAKELAKERAHSAMSFSSNQNAMSSRSLQSMTGKSAPGGFPLYKEGTLVGAVGVAGDGEAQNETIAKAAADGYHAEEYIRSDNVGVKYMGEPAEEFGEIVIDSRSPNTSTKTPVEELEEFVIDSRSPNTPKMPPMQGSPVRSLASQLY